jgi:Leucine-rich repeat (LRR) protein
VCDGWAQCPQRDDEWLCDERPCPETCLCHGLAFVCDQPFHADLYPQLRYLDGTGSGITPHNLTSHRYLVHLSLSRCGLKKLQIHSLPNLKNLDLSFNELQLVNIDIFLNLVSLETLSLTQNPLTRMHHGDAQLKHQSLLHVDLSFTDLEDFSSEALSGFHSLTPSCV